MAAADPGGDIHGCLVRLGRALAAEDRAHEGPAEGIAGTHSVHHFAVRSAQEGHSAVVIDVAAAHAAGQNHHLQAEVLAQVAADHVLLQAGIAQHICHDHQLFVVDFEYVTKQQ